MYVCVCVYVCVCPGLPGIPQDVAGLTRKFETSPVGGFLREVFSLSLTTQ